MHTMLEQPNYIKQTLLDIKGEMGSNNNSWGLQHSTFNKERSKIQSKSEQRNIRVNQYQAKLT
jgi:hypothetical protein